MTDRNAVFDALFALGQRTTWRAGASSEPTAFRSGRRGFKHWGNVGPEEQPALFQTEPNEAHSQVTRMPQRRTLTAMWTVYFRVDQGEADDSATRLMNDILDAIEESVMRGDDPDGNQTLGGRVHHTWIDGDLIKIDGAADGQGMLVIPVHVLIP